MINNYRFLVPDLRGHGDSAWAIGSSYSSLDYVYDIHQLVEQSCLEKVHVVGHSLGGMVACLFSGLFPERVASLTSIEGVGAYWQEKLEKEKIAEYDRKGREWTAQKEKGSMFQCVRPPFLTPLPHRRYPPPLVLDQPPPAPSR